MRENTDQKNSEYGHFSRRVFSSVKNRLKRTKLKKKTQLKINFTKQNKTKRTSDSSQNQFKIESK